MFTENFPRDVAGYIFKLFNDAKDLSHVSLVCKKWNNESSKDIYWEKFISDEEKKYVTVERSAKKIFFLREALTTCLYNLKFDSVLMEKFTPLFVLVTSGLISLETFKTYNADKRYSLLSCLNLIKAGHIKIDELLALKGPQLTNLKEQKIHPLIEKGILPVEVAKKLTPQEKINLSNENLHPYLLNKDDVNKAKSFSSQEEIDNFIKSRQMNTTYTPPVP